MALYIQGRCSTTSKIMTVINCAFKLITTMHAISIRLSPVNKIISFVNHKFHSNKELIVVYFE